MPRGDLYAIKEYSVPYPKEEEQQKIADCLSSLDDLVSAHSKKLDFLKAHKKGLMQQLFPAEGETIPKLRFPVFQKNGVFKIALFSDVSDIKGGKRIPKGYLLTKENTGLPYIRVTDMHMGGVDPTGVLFITKEIEKQIRNYKISRNDLFITVAGTIGIVGEIPNELDNANLTENANKIVVKNVDKQYLLQYLCCEQMQNKIKSSITNNAQPKLSLERIRGFSIPLPIPEEQQQIADCLSSLDDLISAQSQKIDSLKSHKKGLMQQLFPLTGEE